MDSNNTLWTILELVIVVVILASIWKVYTKANKPGWAAIIPFYNIYVQLKIVGRPGWWLILYLIPLVNIVVSLVVSIDTAKSYGKSTAFGVLGLWIFSIIGYPVLGFSDAKYVGPSAGNSATPAAPAAPAAV